MLEFALTHLSRFSDNSDEQLDHKVSAFLNEHGGLVGTSMALGHLRSEGLNIKRERVLAKKPKEDFFKPPINYTPAHLANSGYRHGYLLPGRRIQENEYRKEELEIRKREIQLQAEKQDQTKRQQQAMFSAMMAQIQQQQQLQQNMMSLMKTLMENYNFQSAILLYCILPAGDQSDIKMAIPKQVLYVYKIPSVLLPNHRLITELMLRGIF
ncbi:hypothetical protein P5673_018773 [Acropora cervicornis]|uniref:Uncharacterized protein n=1 Tax=Acropora cervicornis TaxID=6130 RepID=A0AAD9QCC8_ACRCE|nr:hypothetical protein P5673_018773 [Acropora cervicornis]